jgi:hypothetical protein
MNSASRNLKTMTASIQASVRRRRAARAHRRVLEAELATYVTPADRLEIETIADRYPDEESREIREILLAQHAEA